MKLFVKLFHIVIFFKPNTVKVAQTQYNVEMQDKKSPEHPNGYVTCYCDPIYYENFPRHYRIIRIFRKTYITETFLFILATKECYEGLCACINYVNIILILEAASASLISI